MGPLAEILKRRIALQGPLSVAEFMALTLGHPRHGYYAAREPFGAAGDFITAPEISQTFGELLGAWCAVAWQAAGAPDPVVLTELGPGRGTLMADALRAASHAPGFAAAVRVHLVETSARLRAKQAEALAALPLAEPVQWHDALDTVPEGPLLLIANEFFDALPVHHYHRTTAGWCERLVDLNEDGSGFRFVLSAPLGIPPPMPAALQGVGAGAVVEVSPAAITLAEAIGTRIATDGIGALVIDYGHAVSGPGETLQAVRAHRYADVLDDPGTADLTAHVDFAALAVAAEMAGARTWGPVGQGAFLEELGLGARTEALAQGAAPAVVETLRDARQRLTAPDAMGTLFKVLAITGGGANGPPGFTTSVEGGGQ